MKAIRTTVLFVATLVSGAAFAQSEDGAAAAPIYEDETTYDFENDYVEGALIRPDGELISGQRHGKDSSLINIRADFVPEMVQSVEDL